MIILGILEPQRGDMSLLSELFLVLMTRAINISLLTEFGTIQKLASFPLVLKLTPERAAGRTLRVQLSIPSNGY